MSDDYHNARCCAIRADNGKRCTGRWATALPVTFKWDPVNGVGEDGPWAVLCWRHRMVHDRRRPKRIRVVHGWLGGYNQYDVGTCVFKRPDGWAASKWWSNRRQPCTFGGQHRKDAA